MAVADIWDGRGQSVDSPAKRAFAITLSDSDQSIATRAIYVGSGGDIKVDTVDGDTVTFTAVPQGTILPIRARRVYSTGTTASSLVGMY